MSIFKRIFASRNTKQLNKLEKTANLILDMEEEYAAMTNEQLNECTLKFKERLQNGETLEDLLVEAFAVVREASYRVLHMRHYPVQLQGGIVLHQGRIAEMKTGEGKTLVATLPAYLNALSGKGVHIVTVNDYLAKRDAEWMGKIYKFLGLTVGVVVAEMSSEDKRNAYNCDIIYATNNELGFDYLRDNMATRIEDRVQRDLEFAIIDEVDNILIDEARTPLIISGMGESSSEMYVRANDFARKLNEDDYIIEGKEKTVRLSDSGVAKAESYFRIDNLGDLENQDLAHYINNALKAKAIMHKDKDYIITDGQVIIVDEFTGRLMIGRRYSNGLHQAIEAKEGVRIQNESQTLATITFQNYFRLYKKLSGMTGTAKTEENEFQDIYRLDVVELPTNVPVVRKDLNDLLYTKTAGKVNAIINDIKECYKKGQPVLVGTITVDKSEYLAKLLAKERIPCNVLNAKNHAKEAEIIAQAGKVSAVTIATNMAGRGTDIMLGGNPEFLATDKLRRMGFKEELIASALSFAPTTDEEVLKVKDEYKKYYDLFKQETDKEKKDVIAAGGLRVIGTERHESRRIDNQLRGRSGRQGDPGSSIFYLSMEDEMMEIFGGEYMKSISERLKFDDDTPIDNRLITSQIEKAQARVEDRNFSSRKYVLNYDNVMNKQRDLIYNERNSVLENKTDIKDQITNMLSIVVENIVNTYADMSMSVLDWDFEEFNASIEQKLLNPGSNIVSAEICKGKSAAEIEELIYDAAIKHYDEKRKEMEEAGFDFSEVEKYVMLKTVDKHWIEHIDSMDRLKEGVGLRAYGQKDPVVIYSQEGFEMFEEMIQNIQEETIMILFKAVFERQVERSSSDVKKEVKNKNPRADRAKGQASVQTIKRDNKKIGRNEQCPCGSGKKYKNCCGKNE